MLDDCTIGGLNKTIGVVEKYRIHSIDEISALLAWMLDFQSQCGGLNHRILGRTCDLKAAYKQYGLSEADRSLLRLAVRDTDSHSVRYFGLNSLPFSAVGSVGGFLRISMALWFLGLKSLSLAWSAYFDDYTVFCAEPLCRNTDQTVAAFFDLLGINYAKEGAKAVQFDVCLKTLGLHIDLNNFKNDKVLAGHTEARRSELEQTIGDILHAGFVTSKQAESLRGRLLWCESFSFGRIGNRYIKLLGDLAYQEGRSS